MFKQKAQSTLEYVIILTAIIAVILVFAGNFMGKRVQGALESVSTKMENKVNSINIQ